MNKNEKIRLFSGIIIPMFFIMIMWMVKLYEYLFNEHFYQYGILPLNINGLWGIICAPFLHSDFNHLISNTIPFFLLGTALFIFYRKMAYPAFLLMWVLPGAWVWLAARESYHIGASGMVYAMASFLFFSGMIHKIKSLIAVSFTVVFIYGEMFWGVFPNMEGISWESHLFGALVGFLLALFYASKYPFPSNQVETAQNHSSDDSTPQITNEQYRSVRYHLKSTDKKTAV